jgi:hypothetical protein
MVYYGKGGFAFPDIYNMPVFLRNYYLKMMNDEVEKQNNAQEQAAPKAPRR